jgi:WD40 repeat protein
MSEAIHGGVAGIVFLLGTISVARGTEVSLRHDNQGEPLPAGAVQRLGTSRLRMEGQVVSLAISHDQRMIASSDTAGNIMVWEVKTGRRVRRFDSIVRSAGLAFSPDGKRLVAANHGGDACCFDVTTGKCVWSHANPDQFACVPAFAAFLPDGKELLLYRRYRSGDWVSGEVHLIEADSGRENQRVIESQGPILETLALSGDGRYLAQCDRRRVQVFAVRSTERVCDIAVPTEDARSVALSWDGRRLAIGREDIIDLYALPSGEWLGALRMRMQGVDVLHFTRSGQALVSHGMDDRLLVWDLARRKTRDSWSGRASRPMVISGDGSFAVFGKDSSIRLLDLRSGMNLHTNLDGPAEPIRALAYHPRGECLAASGTRTDLTWLWDLKTGRVKRTFPVRSGLMKFSPDGLQLLTAWNSPEDDPLLWATEKETPPVWLRASGWSRMELHGIAFSKAGRDVVAVRTRRAKESEKGDTEVLRFSTATGKISQRRSLKGYEPSLAGVFHSRGLFFFLGGKTAERGAPIRGLYLLDSLTAPLRSAFLHWPDAGEPTYLLASGSGEFLLCARPDSGVFSIVETATGLPVSTVLLPERNLTALAFSPNAHYLASAEITDAKSALTPSRMTIRLWDTANGREVHCFEGHDSSVPQMAFSPDGNYLASALHNGTILIWDVRSLLQSDRKGVRRLDPEEADRLWQDLGSFQPHIAYRAAGRIADMGTVGVDLIRDRFEPALVASPARLKRLLAALNSNRFSDREAASAALAEMRPAIDPTLHRLLKSKPPIEVRERVNALLAGMDGRENTRRRLRAVLALEWMGTLQARRLLQARAKGIPGAPATVAAEAAHDRLARHGFR